MHYRSLAGRGSAYFIRTCRHPDISDGSGKEEGEKILKSFNFKNLTGSLLIELGLSEMSLTLVGSELHIIVRISRIRLAYRLRGLGCSYISYTSVSILPGGTVTCIDIASES